MHVSKSVGHNQIESNQPNTETQSAQAIPYEGKQSHTWPKRQKFRSNAEILNTCKSFFVTDSALHAYLPSKIQHAATPSYLGKIEFADANLIRGNLKSNPDFQNRLNTPSLALMPAIQHATSKNLMHKHQTWEIHRSLTYEACVHFKGAVQILSTFIMWFSWPWLTVINNLPFLDSSNVQRSVVIHDKTICLSLSRPCVPVCKPSWSTFWFSVQDISTLEASFKWTCCWIFATWSLQMWGGLICFSYIVGAWPASNKEIEFDHSLL